MRKLILSVLLATSVAMPAMAQDRDGRERDRGVEEASSEQRDEARAARRAERAERQQAMQQEGGEQRVARQRDGDERRFERRDPGQRQSNNDGMTAAIERQQAAARMIEQRQALAEQRDERRDGRRDGRVRDGSRRDRDWDGDRDRDSQIVVQRDGGDRYQRRYAGSNRHWNNHWRGDRNYNWRNYRHRNRSVFRLGNYWDPYGSHYRRFSIGFSLFPSYYQSNYWLSDPWRYRLPPVYGPYRWVRYYNDALLVNVYTGRVVDVEHGFFW